MPKSNVAWWRAKLAANSDRDARAALQLQDRGWLVLRFWEHEDPKSVADRIEVGIRSR